ncbi:MAG: ATP-binding cassette domain-containing protein [Bacilli bacterium]|nr:ATP-binding cassette domain-containing protein [Bacilli bacterium]
MREAIRFENVTKVFGKVIANRDVSFTIEKGKIYSILGENGSGKTTLMNVIAGIYKQDSGTVYINGEEAFINSPLDAFKYRVGMVHQHFKLVDVFTAIENIAIGLTDKDLPEYNVLKNEEKELGTLSDIQKEIVRLKKVIKKSKLIDIELMQKQLKQVEANYDVIFNLNKSFKEAKKFKLKTIEKRVKTITSRYGFTIDLNKRVCDMSVSEKQTLEIIKVLNRGVNTLILDEPTAVLTPQETEHLFQAIRNMKSHGNTIIIITHKLNEVMEISDKVVILRKGEYIDEIPTYKANQQILTEMMVGKKIELNIKREKPINPQDRLIVKNLYLKDNTNNSSFTKKKNLKNEIKKIKKEFGKRIDDLKASQQKLSEKTLKNKVDALKLQEAKSINELKEKFETESGTYVINNVSFTAKSGEILGIAGISGNGQKELLEAIAGLYPISKGNITLINPKKNQPLTILHKTLKEVRELAKQDAFHYEDGSAVDLTNVKNREIIKLVKEKKIIFNENEIIDLASKDPLQIREAGIHLSFVPEDRLGMGLVGDMDITDNMMLRSYKHGPGLFVHREKPGALADKIIEELDVVTPGKSTKVRLLSGGNIQKVLVGREISFAPKVFMTAYPVRGLDINSSYTIYNLLQEQKKTGVAVIYVGEDLDVLLELCDRIMVLCRGKVSGIFDPKKTSKEKLGLYMTDGSITRE